MMIITKTKTWLAIVTLVLLTSVLSLGQQAERGKKGCGEDFRHREKKCAQVSDGGSTLGYLVIGGSMCLGGLLVRSRLKNSHLS
jgi:hypothetical protein